ncbi:hypothetical protein RND81_13G129600 [Saponaria officinalis]|uniref:Replication protein A 70 kDa DNA-binding subunit B/D first OB fold domain-containing protein n=1 Tax=Saponaria officinalis TaxID=3572 RepID=A0AAW1H3J4_SAPOF
MVLLDMENNTIQASIFNTLHDRFNDKINEGRTYVISRFSVKQNRGTELATTHPCRINFGYSTNVSDIVHLPKPIPMNKFCFANFTDVISRNISEKHYIDLICELRGYSTIGLTRNKGAKYMTINVIDLNEHNLTCNVWGEHTEDITNAIMSLDDANGQAFIILQFVKMVIWNGEIRVSTTNAFRYYLNADIPETQEYKARKNADGELVVPVRLTQTSNEATDIITPDNLIKKSVNALRYCRAKVITNESGRKLCSKEYKGVEATITSIPRFQIKFLVCDGNNDYANFTFLMSRM